MEARGVRKKLGALFVLGCAAFAVLAPFFAASFGIVTVAAQEAAKADPKDKTMFVRTYRVAPDFLSRSQELRDPFAIQDQKAPVVSKQSTERITARQVLEKHGITFPPDASAVFNPSTSQLIVRNTLANIALADSVIDDLSIQFPQVYLTCQMISADRHYGVHGSVLSGDEAKALIQSVSQKKDIHLLAGPRVTTKFGQRAGIEIVREVLPKVLPDGSLSGDMKLLGPRVFIDMSRPEKGKTTLAAEVEFGINPTSEDPWSLKNAAQADWDKVMLHKIAGQAALASGETLLLHLETSKKPLTVLLTAQALDPSGKEISSFDGVRPGASARSQIVAAAAADKQASEWAVRVYQVPAGFAQDKPPLEVLKAAGITFPKAADAMLKDGNLTVRNTKANLELIEAWIYALNKVEVKKSVHLSAKVVEMKGDLVKQMNDWLQPSTEKVDATQAPATTEPPPPAVLQHFILSGIFTPPQFEKLMKRLAVSVDAKLEVLKPNPNPPMYVLPAAMGGQEMKIEPIIGPDGNTIELIIRTPLQDQNPARVISTAVTIWDGQTVVLGSQASEGVSRFLFITGNLIAPLAKK
jgi:type II secretory pathway component GspD/PulD (secretin)